MVISQSSPWNPSFYLQPGLWLAFRAGAAGFGRNPARRLAGGEGKVGGNGKEVEPHLLVAFSRREMVGGGLATASGGRRWPCIAAMALWR